MASQREQDAADYVQKHKLLELMENLNSMLLFHRPGQRHNTPREENNRSTRDKLAG